MKRHILIRKIFAIDERYFGHKEKGKDGKRRKEKMKEIVDKTHSTADEILWILLT